MCWRRFGGAEQARLAYSFGSDAEFVEFFPPMFELLLPRLRKRLDAETVRFRLALGSSRMAVEPVLKKLSFTPQRPWLTFSLEKRAAPAKCAAPKGVSVPARRRRAIIEAIVRIDREAFPDTPMPEAAYRHHLASGDELMIATVGSEVAGFALYSHDGADEGYLSSLAVADAYRGRGIGSGADDARGEVGVRAGRGPSGAAHRRRQSASRSGVYRSLGFKHVGSGNDYERPTEPRVIAAMKKASEGTLIRFGGWR